MAPPSPSTTAQYSATNPVISGQINNTIPGLAGATQQFGQQADQVGRQISQNTPSLNTNFQGFSPTPGLDALSQATVSQGIGMNNAGVAGRDANIASRFGGNPGAAGILQMQNQSNGALANNNLPFQALQSQQARQAQTYQLNNQAQIQGNDALSQQSNLKNNALLQGLQMSQAGIGSNQNLLSILGQLGLQTGTNISQAVPNGQSFSPSWNPQTGGNTGIAFPKGQAQGNPLFNMIQNHTL